MLFILQEKKNNIESSHRATMGISFHFQWVSQHSTQWVFQHKFTIYQTHKLETAMCFRFFFPSKKLCEFKLEIEMFRRIEWKWNGLSPEYYLFCFFCSLVFYYTHFCAWDSFDIFVWFIIRSFDFMWISVETHRKRKNYWMNCEQWTVNTMTGKIIINTIECLWTILNAWTWVVKTQHSIQ